MNKTILITGANRGIGLEFVKQYLAQGLDQEGLSVIACCRKPEKAQALTALMTAKSGKVLALDVTNPQSIQKLVDSLAGQAIDILINNAALHLDPGGKIGNINTDSMREVFETNVIGVVNLTQYLLPNILASHEKKVVMISSIMGTVSMIQDAFSYAYRASKAALNAIMHTLAIDLSDQNVSIIGLHPGWVKTDMGGSKAPVSPENSVAGMIKVIAENKTVSKEGYYDYQGNVIPW